MRIILVFVTGMLFILPGASQAWRAWNWHEVYPLNDTTFEVIGRAGTGPADYWCGAGDFARTVLGVAPTQRIYIWHKEGPSQTRAGHRAVQFAFSPPPGKENYQSGYSLTVKEAGDNLTAAAAHQYCVNRDRFLF